MSCGCQGRRHSHRTCDVCFLIDGRTFAKLVYWCEECQAWICEDCWDKPLRRAAAAAKRVVSRVLG